MHRDPVKTRNIQQVILYDFPCLKQDIQTILCSYWFVHIYPNIICDIPCLKGTKNFKCTYKITWVHSKSPVYIFKDILVNNYSSQKGKFFCNKENLSVTGKWFI